MVWESTWLDTTLTRRTTFASQAGLAEGVVGCEIFPDTAIAPNDCIPFPELKTQSENKLVGMACSLCARRDLLGGQRPG